jgi:hypothetical protein
LGVQEAGAACPAYAGCVHESSKFRPDEGAHHLHGTDNLVTEVLDWAIGCKPRAAVVLHDAHPRALLVRQAPSGRVIRGKPGTLGPGLLSFWCPAGDAHQSVFVKL